MLIHLKNFELEFYNNIKNKKLTIQELVDKVESIFSVEYFTNQEDEYIRLFCNGEAYMIMFYNNYIRNAYSAPIELMIIDGEEKKLTFNTKTVGKSDKNMLIRFLIHFNQFQFNDLKIDYLLNKIDLIDNIS